MKRVIQLQISRKHQEKLGYENPLIELEVDHLLGEDYDLDNVEKDKRRILKLVRNDMRIPPGYLILENYDVVNFRDYQIHIFPR